MYTNTRRPVRVNGIPIEDFAIKVGVQGPVVFCSLWYLKHCWHEFRSGCPQELLYYDDRVLITESME